MFLPWASDPAVAAADVSKLLADQPAESLVAKLQPAEVPAVGGAAIERSAFKVDGHATGSAVSIESNAQPMRTITVIIAVSDKSAARTIKGNGNRQAMIGPM